MWFHLEPINRGYEAARSGVAVSDSPFGPFNFIESILSASAPPVAAATVVTVMSVTESIAEGDEKVEYPHVDPHFFCRNRTS